MAASHRRWGWIAMEAAVGLAILGWGAGAWWSPPGWAQIGGCSGGGASNNTTTCSTSTETVVGFPPGVFTIVSTTTTFGPACIGIGDRDVPNPSPACGSSPAAPPPVDPAHGTVFLVAAGTVNVNTHTLTRTVIAAAQVPALPGVLGVAAAALGVGTLGLWRLRRRRGRRREVP